MYILYYIILYFTKRKRSSSSEVVVNFIFIYVPIPVNTSRISYYTNGKFDLAFQFVSEHSADEYRKLTKQRKRR